MKSSSSHFAIKLLRWFCHPALIEDVEGDLMELFEDRAITNGEWKAKWLMWWDVLKLFRPGIIRGLSSQNKMSRFGMIRNYFITAIRSAKKEKAFTVLNITCLSIGFTACLYIAMYSMEELSYDSFHEKADRIYRINQTYIWGNTDDLFGSTGPAVMTAIESEVPEFETMTRVHTFEDAIVSTLSNERKEVFEEGQVRGADSTFFQVFSFPLIKGNPNTALVNPNSVVLTESMARKYFGSIDILGEQLKIESEEKNNYYRITGVAADIPSNSHVTFNLLISMSSLDRLKGRHNDSWVWTTFVTFGVLRPDADVELVARKVASVPGNIWRLSFKSIAA